MPVIIAEDDPVSRALISAMVKKWGFRTIETRDGYEAMAAIRAQEGAALAILDWVMPGMDGLEVCRSVRASEKMIYIVMLSVRGGTENLVEGLEGGADDYLVKPFDRNELLARLKVGLRVLDLQTSLANRVRELEQALSEHPRIQDRCRVGVDFTSQQLGGFEARAETDPRAPTDSPAGTPRQSSPKKLFWRECCNGSLTSFAKLSGICTMKETLADELTQLGLTPTEAQVYLALVQNGPMGASAIAAATGLARTAVYPTLGALIDKGLAEAGEGYGSRFSPVPAEKALPHLLAADKAALLHRERLTAQVVELISSLEEQAETVPDELLQVLRGPRALTERFERLQLEAEHSINCLVKGTYFVDPSNSTQEKVLRRGVHCKALYESRLLDDPATKARVQKWTELGEEARLYHGELPQKLVIFDSRVVLMPIARSGESLRTVVIRHPELAQTLSLAFQYPLGTEPNPLLVSNPKKPGRRGMFALVVAPAIETINPCLEAPPFSPTPPAKTPNPKRPAT